VLVDPQDQVAEIGVPEATLDVDDPGHADGVEQILVDRDREVVVEQAGDDGVDEGGVASQALVERLGEAAVGVDRADRGDPGIVAPGGLVEVGLERSPLRDLPEAVGLEVPERVLGAGLAGRPEVREELAESQLEVGEGDEARLAPLQPGELVKQQERLVRGSLSPAPPHGDAGETLDQGVCAG